MATYLDLLSSTTLDTLNDIRWQSDSNIMITQLLLEKVVENLNNEEDRYFAEEERISWNGFLCDNRVPFRLIKTSLIELRISKKIIAINNNQIGKLISRLLNNNYFQSYSLLFYNKLFENCNSNLRIIEDGKGKNLVEIANIIKL